jgi:4-aminobutyrate aminotransferase-like enzyme
MNVSYERCSGSELFTADGRRILDFLSGYCVHNTGHNHPAIIAALKEELDRELVMRLFRDHKILTQICGNNFMVLKVAPPLVATEGQLEEFAAAIREVVDLAHNSSGFWAEAVGLARRAVNI